MAGLSDDLGGILGAPITITSGYRDPQRNALVGGVPNSAHLTGNAYDFVPKGISTTDAANRLAKSGIPFDQLIDEGSHVHISFAPANRRQVISKVAQNDVSDSDLLKAMGAPAQPQAAAPAKDSGNVSDDQLLSTMSGAPAPKASPGGSPKPSGGDYFPAGDSRNGPAAVTVGGGPPQPDQSSDKPSGFTLADMIHTLPGALLKSGAAVAGFPGDINALLDSAGNAITGAKISTNNLPTSSGITNTIAKPFGGLYEPQTTAGKYTNTIAQFAPAAVAPGNALLRAARVAVPGIASETGGEATAGTAAEPFARLGGALLAGKGISMAKNAIENPAVKIPSTADIKAAATAAYKRAEQAGVVIKESAVKDLGKEISQATTEAGIDPTLHPKATAAIKRLVDSKGDLSLKQMDILRRVANGAAGSFDPDESRIAHIALDHIDDFVENLGAGHTVAGNTQDATDAIKEARKLWAVQSKSSVVDNLLERAKNRAETVGGSGIENALRVEFRQLAQNPKRLSRFSDAEQDAIRQVARGTPIGNLARTVGKLSPFHNIFSMLAEMGAIAHDPKALALPAVGTLGRMVAEQSTKGNALAASKLIRSGGAQQSQPVFTPEMLSALLARKNNQEQQNNLVPNFAQ